MGVPGRGHSGRRRIHITNQPRSRGSDSSQIRQRILTSVRQSQLPVHPWDLSPGVCPTRIILLLGFKHYLKSSFESHFRSRHRHTLQVYRDITGRMEREQDRAPSSPALESAQQGHSNEKNAPAIHRLRDLLSAAIEQPWRMFLCHSNLVPQPWTAAAKAAAASPEQRVRLACQCWDLFF